uniref:CD1e1 molecule n=1 Tax=Equus caballus TaxID=9796 RepID=A0A5F5PMQ8_HORSE
MLLLLLLLFKGLPCHGASTVSPLLLGFHHPAAEEPLSYHFIQISSFANHSWAYTQASGWLGEMETEAWDSVSGTIRFLKPWSQGNFSKEELKNLEALLELYLHSFTTEVQVFASQFQFELKPEAWVSKGPSPGPGHLMLVCHVSGFHPKPVWVMWMRGEQEQPGTQRGDVLPNADGTWYLRVTLDVTSGEAAGLTCRVKHSSLGGHDIIIHWDGNSILLILICLTVIVILVMLVVVDLRFKKQSSNQNILYPHVPNPAFSTRTNTRDPRSSGHPLCLAQDLWIKSKFLKNWKTSLKRLW